MVVMGPLIREEDIVVITTPDFRRGQVAAWRDFAKDPEATPNRDLLARLVSAEFAAGYLDEWENFCVPLRPHADRG